MLEKTSSRPIVAQQKTKGGKRTKFFPGHSYHVLDPFHTKYLKLTGPSFNLGKISQFF
jgi:hypothetical protein